MALHRLRMATLNVFRKTAKTRLRLFRLFSTEWTYLPSGGRTTSNKRKQRRRILCFYIYNTKREIKNVVLRRKETARPENHRRGKQRRRASGMKPEKTAGGSELQYVQRSDGASLNPKKGKKNRTDSMTWKKNKEQVCFQSETKKAMQVTPRVFTESKERVTAARIVEWQTENCFKSRSVFFFCFVFPLCVFLLSWQKLGAGGCKHVDMLAGCLVCFLAERKEGERRKKKSASSTESAQRRRLKRESGASP